jgi:hypothetical protein
MWDSFAAGLMLNTSYNIHVDSGEDPLVRQIVISMQVGWCLMRLYPAPA